MDPNLLMQLVSGQGGYTDPGPTPYDVRPDTSMLQQLAGQIVPEQPKPPGKFKQFLGGVGEAYARARPESGVAKSLDANRTAQAEQEQQAFEMLMGFGEMARDNAAAETKRQVGRHDWLSKLAETGSQNPNEIVDYGVITGEPDLLGFRGPRSGLSSVMSSVASARLRDDKETIPASVQGVHARAAQAEKDAVRKAKLGERRQELKQNIAAIEKLAMEHQTMGDADALAGLRRSLGELRVELAGVETQLNVRSYKPDNPVEGLGAAGQAAMQLAIVGQRDFDDPDPTAADPDRTRTVEDWYWRDSKGVEHRGYPDASAWVTEIIPQVQRLLGQTGEMPLF